MVVRETMSPPQFLGAAGPMASPVVHDAGIGDASARRPRHARDRRIDRFGRFHALAARGRRGVGARLGLGL